MSTLTLIPPALKAALPEWLPLALGLLVLYVPTLHDLLTGLWSTEAQMHGPIIFALGNWLIFRNWQRLPAAGSTPATALGWLILLAGLMLYSVGRSQLILQFELGSYIWVLAGLLLIKRGFRAIAVMWFPLFFLLFMVPLPGTLVIMLTMPMKMAVSYVAENILYWSGYPIARSGVILQIGQYQLLVADACAGLQTLLTLEALGLFYLNVVRHNSVFRNFSLALLIVPISFTANVTRVIALTLITYYLGETAGQGFLHQFAGLVLFLSALILIISFDTLLQYLVRIRAQDAAGNTGARG